MTHAERKQVFAGLIWLLLLTFVSLQARAEPLVVESGPAQVGLLELYTSEGCSSCPPADRYFSTLRASPALFAELVPVAFHVDYWNYLGWRDRFATSAYSDRQRAHVKAGRGRTVYTPGFFYNGREWREFFGGDLSDFPPPGEGGQLRVEVDGRKVSVRYQRPDNGNQPLTATVAVLGFGLTTDVRRGENRGRTLGHDFVVLGLSEFALTPSADAAVADGQLPEAEERAADYAVAVWISDARTGAPLQAAGLAL